jgi:hypothetical protein
VEIISDPYSCGVPSESAECVDHAVRELLNRALTCGEPPRAASIVGPATRAAITAVAHHHPDATAEHIIAVYDAYTLEQHPDTPATDRPQQLGDERTAQAADYAATDTLITQLTITYPGIPRDTIASIVKELQTALADPRLRGLNLLRIEYEAHQWLSRAQ